MSIVTLTINDTLVSAKADSTLLTVIREQGIDIPTLCHMKGLSERGGCRLCLVEMQGSPRLFASCVTPVQEGLVVQTHSERLANYRRMIVELLLAERNHICAVCVMNGHCELQSLAAKLGVDHVRYEYLNPKLPMDASHDRYVMDHNRCVLCGRCNRVCDEVEGAHTLDMADRGVNTRVIADMNKPWGTSKTCTGCGKCVQACPTGALFKKGVSAAEMEKHHEFVPRIVNGREKRIWPSS